jgi:hypothetical protein
MKNMWQVKIGTIGKYEINFTILKRCRNILYIQIIYLFTRLKIKIFARILLITLLFSFFAAESQQVG